MTCLSCLRMFVCHQFTTTNQFSGQMPTTDDHLIIMLRGKRSMTFYTCRFQMFSNILGLKSGICQETVWISAYKYLIANATSVTRCEHWTNLKHTELWICKHRTTNRTVSPDGIKMTWSLFELISIQISLNTRDQRDHMSKRVILRHVKSHIGEAGTSLCWDFFLINDWWWQAVSALH